MEIVLSVLVSILSIALIAVVLLQDGKSIIAASTKWLAAAWLVLTLCLSFVH